MNYLESRNIFYRIEGKNVGREDVAISCLFCDDPSYHLNIHKTIGMYHCWACGAKGGIFNLIKTIEPEGTRIKDILADYFGYETREKKERKPFKVDFNDLDFIQRVGYKGIYENLFWPLLSEWIEDRGFDKEDLYKWDISLAKERNHYFSYRIIVSVWEEGERVCLVGRDMTGKAKIRYLPAPNGSMRKNYQSCLYNIDLSLEKGGLIFVEGIFDVWRLSKIKELDNYAVIGTLGKVLSSDQAFLIRNLVSRRNLMEVVVCLDGGSEKEVKKFIETISPYHRNITVVELPEGEDPDSLGKKGQFEYYFYRRKRII